MTKFTYNEEETRILKNFSEINTGMIIDPDGFKIVNGQDKSVVGVYYFENPYGYSPYGIYDLKEFLSGLNLYDSELDIHEKYIEISNTKQGISTKYRNTSLDMLPGVKDLSEKFDKIDCELDFTLSAEKYAVMKKIIQLYGTGGSEKNKFRIYFRSVDKNTIRLILTGKLQSSEFEPELQENATEILFKDAEVHKSTLPEGTVLYIKAHEFKLLEGDYHVKISSRKISNWKNINIDKLQYFIGVANVNED